MSRPHDLGGVETYGEVPSPDDDAVFHHDWEAPVSGLQRLFLGKGTYTLDEFRDAIERVQPRDYFFRSYYQRWLAAMIVLLTEQGIVQERELAQQ